MPGAENAASQVPDLATEVRAALAALEIERRE